jgi:hypothetical protein
VTWCKVNLLLHYNDRVFSVHAAVFYLQGRGEAATRLHSHRKAGEKAVEDMLIGMVQQGQIKLNMDEKR